MSALALDRQAIEKKDFPISRRGYEPEAVDLHLEALAADVERLQQELDQAQRAASTPQAAAAPRPAATQSLALAASEQVRLIVEAAESSAADIERSAQEEAARIRADADTQARQTRQEAVGRAEDHVSRVTEATGSMLQRVDAMEGELGALLESLRTGTNRLTADLSLLQGNLGDLYGAAGAPAQAPAPPAPPAPEAPRRPDPEPEPEPVAIEPEPEPEPEPAEPEPEPQPFESFEDEPVATAPGASAAVPEPPAEPGQSDGDVEGARLIALNMALNGQSREETDTYLRENFDLGDRTSLLDEVYASVEG